MSTTPHAFPPGATWPVAIPLWATTMVVTWVLSDMLYNGASGWARGWIYPVFGASVSSPALSFPQTLVSLPTQTGGFRHTISGGATAAIGPSLRGTTQTMQFAQTTDGTNTGVCAADEGTQLAVTYEFQQLSSAS